MRGGKFVSKGGHFSDQRHAYIRIKRKKNEEKRCSFYNIYNLLCCTFFSPIMIGRDISISLNPYTYQC